MTAMNDCLRKMETSSHLLPEPGGEAVRSCIRAIRVLVEQRDAAHEESEGNQLALEHQRQIEDAAVLAELEKP